MPLPTDRIVLEGPASDAGIGELTTIVQGLGGRVLGHRPLRFGATAVRISDLGVEQWRQAADQANGRGLRARSTGSYADGTIRPTTVPTRGGYGVDRGHGDGWRLMDDRFVWQSPAGTRWTGAIAGRWSRWWTPASSGRRDAGAGRATAARGARAVLVDGRAGPGHQRVVGAAGPGAACPRRGGAGGLPAGRSCPRSW